jgi:hypothetical protein
MERTYDGDGRELTSYRYSLDDRMLSGNQSSYTLFGHLHESIVVNHDTSMRTKDAYEYQYDTHGNWTFKKRLVSNNEREDYDSPRMEHTRRITYH